MRVNVRLPEMWRCVVLLAITVLMPAIASAQVPAEAGADPSTTASVLSRDAEFESGGARSIFAGKRFSLPAACCQPSTEYSRWKFESTGITQATGRSRRSAVGWGIAIGVVAGVATSGLAASKYGENEGGRFCGRCFVEWSALTVPVGAGLGAAVGYLIDKARR
jgi:hypothetical protein